MPIEPLLGVASPRAVVELVVVVEPNLKAGTPVAPPAFPPLLNMLPAVKLGVTVAVELVAGPDGWAPKINAGVDVDAVGAVVAAVAVVENGPFIDVDVDEDDEVELEVEPNTKGAATAG